MEETKALFGDFAEEKENTNNTDIFGGDNLFGDEVLFGEESEEAAEVTADDFDFGETVEAEEEPWAKDPKGIEIAERLLEVSKNLIGSIDPVVNNDDFKNELANIFVCMKYLQIQRMGLKERCPNIYDIETEIRAITKQQFMNDISYDINVSIAAMNLNQGDPDADEENLDLIFRTIGKALVAQIKAAKSAAAARG